MRDHLIAAGIAATASFATPAAAQGFEYLTYGAGYAQVDFDGIGELTNYGANLGFDYDGGDYLVVGEIEGLRREGPALSVTGWNVDLLFGYRIEPNLILLAGVDHENLSSGDDTDYSLGTEYDRGAFTLGAYGTGGEGGADGIEWLHVYGGYRLSEATEISLQVSDRNGSSTSGTTYDLIVDHEQGPLEVVGGLYGETGSDDLTLSVGAIYDFGNRFRARGYVRNGTGDAFSLLITGLGAGYEVRDDLWLDLIYATANGTGGVLDSDKVSLHLRFETGRRNLLRTRMADARDKVLMSF